jgi:hypothetical protein
MIVPHQRSRRLRERQPVHARGTVRAEGTAPIRFIRRFTNTCHIESRLNRATPPACCRTAEAKAERKARWVRAAGLRGLGGNRRQHFACRMSISTARALRDGGGEAGAQGALDGCGGMLWVRRKARQKILSAIVAAIWPVEERSRPAGLRRRGRSARRVPERDACGTASAV